MTHADTFERLRDAFKARKHTLMRSGDGFVAVRWGLIKHLDNIPEAVEFLRRIGGELETHD